MTANHRIERMAGNVLVAILVSRLPSLMRMLGITDAGCLEHGVKFDRDVSSVFHLLLY